MDKYKFYDQGWNDYVDGQPWPSDKAPTVDYRDGWFDAREFTLDYGHLPENI